jgi:hypothetical protein
MDRYDEALNAARKTLDDGSIDEIYTSRDEYGYRRIEAHCSQGWFTFFNEADDNAGSERHAR